MKTLEELNARIGSLHDSVLLGIDMQWAEGTVTFAIRTAGGPLQLVVREVTRLVCPREYPWGRSISISEIRLGTPPLSASLQVEIEMQSGDVLAISGGEIGVDA